MRYLAAVGIILGFVAFAAAASTFDEVVIQAQTAVDTGRPDEGIRLFARAAAMEPGKASTFAVDHAWAYVEKALAEVIAEDYAEADKYCAKAMAICPEAKASLATARITVRNHNFWKKFAYARSDAARADWGLMVTYARDMVSISVDSTVAHFDLGTAYEWSGAGAKAAAEYRTALGTNAPDKADLATLREAAKKAYAAAMAERRWPIHPLQERVDPGNFAIYEDGPFVIHHHNLELAKRTGRALKYYISQKEVDGLLEPLKDLPTKCHIYIYRTGKEMQEATKCPEWADGLFAAGLFWDKGQIVFYFVQDSPNMLNGTAPHELGHMRLALLLGRDHKRPPQWLNEGVAMSCEPWLVKRVRAEILTRVVHAGRLYHTADVMRAPINALDSETVGTVYVECMAMVGVFAERGNGTRLRDFSEGLESGKEAAALKREYNITPDNLDRLIMDWATRHRTWGQ